MHSALLERLFPRDVTSTLQFTGPLLVIMVFLAVTFAAAARFRMPPTFPTAVAVLPFIVQFCSETVPVALLLSMAAALIAVLPLMVTLVNIRTPALPMAVSKWLLIVPLVMV